MTLGERFYVLKLVRNILSRGYSISVNDGEDWTLTRNRHENQIMAALGTTEMDTIVFRDEFDDKIMGRFVLIYGNDPDGNEVIADHTDNRMCNNIWREVMGWPEEDQLEIGL